MVEVSFDSKKVTRRIRVGGQPTKLVANRAGTRIYVANANSDSVSVVDRDLGASISEVPTPAPSQVPDGLRGSNPNALALSPDEKTLYVTNGGNSTLAVIALSERDRGAGVTAKPSRVIGLVPTGFYPNAVSVSRDGGALFVAHGKSPTGPNPKGPWSDPVRSRQDPSARGVGNQYSLQIGARGAPGPSGADGRHTRQADRAVDLNNRFLAGEAKPQIFAELAAR